MNVFYMFLALVGGVCIPLQVGVNTELAQRMGSSVWAAGASFLVGTLCLILCAFSLRVSLPAFAAVKSAPWWLWTGGMFGAYLVFASILVAPKLGALTLMALVITGQLGASIIFDHWGLLGFPVHEINWGRVTGVILLTAGVLLMRIY